MTTALPAQEENPAPSEATLARAKVHRAVAFVALFTAIFYIPSLRCGFFADDWLHRLALDQFPDIFREHLNLFGLIRSNEEVAAFKKFGLAPWWTDPDMRINFWRPIPSITHWLEYQLFGHSAIAAHLINIGFYTATVFLVHRLLARYLSPSRWPLVFAVAVFALDDAHALNIVWSANRNETVGAIFVLASLLSFIRYREGAGRAFAGLSLLSYACALLSKESGLVLPLFVLAHVVVFPERPGQPFFARIRPHLGMLAAFFLVSVAFLALYFVVLGHGANSVYYINPLKNPGLWAEHFFRSGFFHAVILATGVPLHVLSSTPVRDYPLAALALGAVTVGFWALAWRWLRNDRPLRFFVLTMVAGQVIVTTSFPDPRNLFLPSIGFAYMVARVLEEAVARFPKGRSYRAVAGTLVFLHLVLAPVLCQVCIYIVATFEGRYRVIADSLAKSIDYQRLPEDKLEVYFLNWHQREMTALYGLYLRRVLPTGVTDYKPITHNPNISYVDKLYQGLGGERIHYYSLSYVVGEVDVEVLSEYEIAVRPKKGHFFPTLFEQLYTTGKPWRAGQVFEPGTHRATIEEVSPEGEVSKVRFTFPEPLSSPRYRFMKWDGERFVPVSFVAVAGRGD
ncbi:ArnT family glycosyltransferase [Polyangium mundeleinium]|uniref:Glycosyltransferase family 39 protein n=1 Tax=Polyangium mundeleinium TaxID=2995306 RepID=A0ABT5EZB0_9BACT|nr:glycosyltransferase family 39 protein [Polyangium mundeleinium]MDC0747185.1 glycosyltransferase family 39 protein [Polyangium mundeleinium]